MYNTMNAFDLPAATRKEIAAQLSLTEPELVRLDVCYGTFDFDIPKRTPIYLENRGKFTESLFPSGYSPGWWGVYPNDSFRSPMLSSAGETKFSEIAAS